MTLAPSLAALAAQVDACYVCEGMDYCHVLGEANGPLDACVMFVGEAPGRFGAGRSGVPFSGDEAGKRFEALLAIAALTRAEVFVTNALLCNPLDGLGRNRPPARREVQACAEHLRAQIQAVQPEFVVSLGVVALNALAAIEPHDVVLSQRCGQVIEWYGARLVPLYHPGRRALVHRSEARQQDDWRALGELVRATEGASSAEARKPRLR